MKPSALFQPWAAAAADDSTDHVEAVELIGGLDGIDGRVAGPRWDAIDVPFLGVAMPCLGCLGCFAICD